MRWLCKLRHLLPSLMIWVQASGPTKWKERTNLSSDLTCVPWHIHKHIQSYGNIFWAKLMWTQRLKQHAQGPQRSAPGPRCLCYDFQLSVSVASQQWVFASCAFSWALSLLIVFLVQLQMMDFVLSYCIFYFVIFYDYPLNGCLVSSESQKGGWIWL